MTANKNVKWTSDNKQTRLFNFDFENDSSAHPLLYIYVWV